MLRHESYKRSGIKWLGDVPAHWDVRPGFTCFEENKDRNKKLTEKTVLSLSYGRIVVKSEDKMTGLVPESFDTYQLIKPDDIVIRTTDLQNDKTSLRVGLARDKGMITSAYLGLRCKPEINPEYVFRLLESYDALKVFYGMGSGLRQNIDFWDFKRLPVPLPPRAEQDRIVTFLDQKTSEINDAIAKKERLIELLSEQHAAVITKETREPLNGHTSRDSKIAWLGRIPANHRLTRIGFIAKIGNGSTPNRSVLGYWDRGSIPWMNSSRVNDFEIVEADQFITPRAVRECHLPMVKAGSLLVAITGEGKTRGMTAITRIDTTINQHLAYISVTDPQVEPEYLLYYLTGIYQVLRDESSAQGSTKGAITCGELSKVPVLLPSLEEQRTALVRIKNQLHHVNQSRDVTRRQINALLAFRTALISDAVTGKMRIS